MKTKNTKRPKLQKVHPKPRLIEILKKEFERIGYYTEAGRLSDGSGAWLEVYKTNEVKDMRLASFCFSFNDAGTQIDDLSFFIEKFEMASSGTNKIY